MLSNKNIDENPMKIVYSKTEREKIIASTNTAYNNGVKKNISSMYHNARNVVSPNTNTINIKREKIKQMSSTSNQGLLHKITNESALENSYNNTNNTNTTIITNTNLNNINTNTNTNKNTTNTTTSKTNTKMTTNISIDTKNNNNKISSKSNNKLNNTAIIHNNKLELTQLNNTNHIENYENHECLDLLESVSNNEITIKVKQEEQISGIEKFFKNFFKPFQCGRIDEENEEENEEDKNNLNFRAIKIIEKIKKDK